MKGLFLIIGVVLLACGCGHGSSLVGGSDEGQVRALFNQQRDLMRDANWRELYQTYSSTFRDECPYSRFLETAPSASSVDLSKIGYDNLEISVSGDKAYATYIMTYKGTDVKSVDSSDPDVYVRENGRWYDELDSHTTCD